MSEASDFARPRRMAAHTEVGRNGIGKRAQRH